MIKSGHKKILLIDQTGRGHALCELFVRTDPNVTVYYAPGCRAITHDRIISVPHVLLNNVQTAVDFYQQEDLDFVMVSHITSLASGYVDALKAHSIPVIGPDRQAAMLETSKYVGKLFCDRHKLPMPRFSYFSDYHEARRYAKQCEDGAVIKIDGLCAMSDGAYVCYSACEAMQAVDAVHDRLDEFSCVIEERLSGQEISIFMWLDGGRYILFPDALDYKRYGEGNTGINCDGMGSIAPHPRGSEQAIMKSKHEIADKILRGIQADGIAYTGFLYVAGFIVDQQVIKIIEINVRFGDSEAEVVLPSVQSNFYEICMMTLSHSLPGELITDDLKRCSVALVQGSVGDRSSPGWPLGEFDIGQIITGLNNVNSDKVDIYYAGLDKVRAQLLTTNGRVMHVVGKGKTYDIAIRHAYDEINKVDYPGMHFRKDIGIR